MEDRIVVGLGSSDQADPRQAGWEAAEAALAQCHNEADIAFAFATVDYDPEQLMAGLKQRLGVIPIHGGTSFTGLITPAGFLANQTGVVSVLTLSTPYIQFGTGYAELDGNPVEAGAKAAQMALAATDVPGGTPDVVLMTASPGNEEDIIHGIAQVMGEDVPIIGGSVADNTVEGHWRVFTSQGTMPSGVVLTAFFSHLPLGYAFGSGYKPTGKKATATKATGRTIHELDGRHAVDVYAEWIGRDPKELSGMSILGASILQPVGIRDKESKFHLVKHPGIVQDDGSIVLFAEVKEGDEILLLGATVDELIAEIPETIHAAMDLAALEEEDVATLLLIHCGGRRGAIGERMGEVADRIRETLGQDVPFLSYLTFGEQGCLETGRNVHCDLLLSALVIGK